MGLFYRCIFLSDPYDINQVLDTLSPFFAFNICELSARLYGESAGVRGWRGVCMVGKERESSDSEPTI